MGKKQSMPWKDAILKVLTESSKAMHYREIAESISKNEYRASEDLGATPAIIVNNVLHNDKFLKDKVEVAEVKGYYKLKGKEQKIFTEQTEIGAKDSEEFLDTDELITVYGRFWDKNLFEKNQKGLYGKNYLGSSIIEDFSNHMGVYLLHKGYQVVYVGKATKLSKRLGEHLNDSLRNKWDSFSWFSVTEGENPCEKKNKNMDHSAITATLEALLIEILGPDRNKKDGDNFMYKEIEQVQKRDYDMYVSAKASITGIVNKKRGKRK